MYIVTCTCLHAHTQVVWELKSHESNQLMFEHVSPAGTEGYPGTLTSTAKYTLTENNELHLTYTARTDAPTIVSLTNHTYFNLAGKVSTRIHTKKIAPPTHILDMPCVFLNCLNSFFFVPGVH